MHLDSPGLCETKPALQLSQADSELALRMALAVPAAHTVQGDRPVADQDPGLQTETQSDFDVDPGGEDMSLGHSRQSFKLVDPG